MNTLVTTIDGNDLVADDGSAILPVIDSGNACCGALLLRVPRYTRRVLGADRMRVDDHEVEVYAHDCGISRLLICRAVRDGDRKIDVSDPVWRSIAARYSGQQNGWENVFKPMDGRASHYTWEDFQQRLFFYHDLMDGLGFGSEWMSKPIFTKKLHYFDEVGRLDWKPKFVIRYPKSELVEDFERIEGIRLVGENFWLFAEERNTVHFMLRTR